MTTPITTINGSLVALSAAIMAEPELAGVPYGLGKLAIEANVDHPYVFWIPGTGNVTPSQNIGGRLVAGVQQTRPRQCFTRSQLVNIVCWGADAAAAEVLVHGICAASWRLMATSVEFGAVEWITQTSGKFAKRGEMVSVAATFLIPILEQTGTLTPVETIEGPTTAFL